MTSPQKKKKHFLFSTAIMIFIILFFVFQNCQRGTLQSAKLPSRDNQFENPIESATPELPSKSKPNIVVIMVDDQDDDNYMPVMPKMENWIKKEGVLFKNSFVNFSWCCPSRASFLSGQFAINSKVRGNGGKLWGGGYISFQPSEIDSLPVWLQNTGYRTAMIGKYLNGWEMGENYRNIPKGWNHWRGMKFTYRYYDYNIVLGTDGIFDGLEPHGTPDSPRLRPDLGPQHTELGAPIPGRKSEDYQTTVLTQKAVEFLSSASNFKDEEGNPKPFFLWLTPMAVHVQEDSNIVVPPPKYIISQNEFVKGLQLPAERKKNYNVATLGQPSYVLDTNPIGDKKEKDLTSLFRQRRAALQGVDDMVSAVMNALETNNLLDNTLIIFTSDNGFFHGEHRKPEDKQEIYDEAIRVPLLMRGPGIPKNKTIESLVVNVDVTATILDFAGILDSKNSKATTGARILDGRSLKPLWSGNNIKWRTAILNEGLDRRPFLSDENEDKLRRVAGIRSKNYMYARHIKYGTGTYESDFLSKNSNPTRSGTEEIIEEELYDMVSDPDQLCNLANTQENPLYIDIKKWLRDRALAQLKNCSGSLSSHSSSCWFEENEPALNTSTRPECRPHFVHATIDNKNKYTEKSLTPPTRMRIHRNHILKLQEFLVKENFLEKSKANGIFESSTVQSLKEFQRSQKLPVSGKIDRSTLSAINSIIEYEEEMRSIGEQ